MRARVLALGFITLISLMLCVYVLAGAQRTAAAVPAFPRLHPEATPPPTGNLTVTPASATTFAGSDVFASVQWPDPRPACLQAQSPPGINVNFNPLCVQQSSAAMQVHVTGNVPAGLYPLSIVAHDQNNPIIVLDTTTFYLIVQPSFESGTWQAPKLNPDIGETICTEEHAVCTDPDEMSGILDPVYLHSGEFVVGEAPDLKIAGRGIDYEFRRTYKSQICSVAKMAKG